MVATRKGPSAPGPNLQRASSTQPIPRSTSKGKLTNTTTKSNVKSTATHTPKSNTSNKKLKQLSRKRKPHLLATLSILVLQFLALYALLTCPSSRNSSSPLCRSVVTYKRHVLDPYILPPIQRALSHPVAQPYVQKAHYVQKQVEPYVVRSVQAAEPVAKKLGEYAEKTKVGVWDGFLVPKYREYVIPQYQTHLAPHVNHLITLYHTRVSPHVVRAQSAVVSAYHAVWPHVERAYGVIKPLSIRIWLNVKPQLIKAWKFSRPHLISLWRQILKGLNTLANRVGDKRRQYVDPHISRIWEKASELSRNGASSSSSTSETIPETDATTIEPTPSESAFSTDSIPAVTSSVEPTPETLSSAAAEEPVSTVIPEDTEAPASAEVPVSTTEPEVTSSSVEASASSVGLPPPEPPVEASSTEEVSIEQSSTSSVTASEIPSSIPVQAVPSSAHEASSSPPSEPSSASSLPSTTPTDIPADDYEELFGDLEEKQPEEVATTTAAAVPTPTSDDDFADLFGDLDDKEDGDASLSPEELAAIAAAKQEAEAQAEKLREEQKQQYKKEQTAIKRKDILERHTEWEKKLDALITQGRADIRSKLDEHRRKNLAIVLGKYEGDKEVTDSSVRAFVDGAAKEGERLLVGLETFMGKTLKGKEEGKKWNEEGSLKKWDKALDRVKEKFEEVLKKAQADLFEWYSVMRSWEIQQVLDMETNATELASAGQTDVGFDYVWLDDVTHRDWKRYHALMSTAQAFGEEIRTIQNGTHPEPPNDPIPDAMTELQQEMEDIIQGFETAWRSLKKAGIDKFTGAYASSGASKGTGESSSTTQAGKAEDPTYSILPISPGEELKQIDETLKKTDPGAFVGRGAQEVVEALERAGDAGEHVEL